MIGQLQRIQELHGLADHSASREIKNLVSIASGKGGTGKTLFSILLAQNFAVTQKKILLVDLDFNFSNSNILLNCSPKKTLYNYFVGAENISKVITKYSSSLDVVFGFSGKLIENRRIENNIDKLLNDIENISSNYDLVIMDLGSGLSESSIKSLNKSHIKILVTLPEPTAVMDAYSAIKIFENRYSKSQFNIVVNRCLLQNEGEETFSKLEKAVKSFLLSEVSFLTSMNESLTIRKLISEQDTLTENLNDDSVISSFSTAVNKINKIIHLTNINQIR